MRNLRTIDEFKTDEEYRAIKDRIERLVGDGKLREQGLDPSEPFRFIEMYISDEGETWLLAQPDQAFRGYLKKK
jgi:hypothetical protein